MTPKLLLPLLLLLPAALPARAAEDALLVDRSVLTPPPWDEAVGTTDVERYATAEEYAAASTDPRFRLEKVRYRSDGLTVAAYLYGPPPAAADGQSAPSPPRPVVVFNRGSYVRGEIAPELLPMFHRLAAAGFTVVAPMLRGSAGAEGRDEMGGADLADLMAVPALLPELGGGLDPEDLFLYGESRGGMMVFQAIRDGFPARAAATFGAFTDLEGLVSTEQGAAMAKAIWPDFAERRGEIVERRSALHWAGKLDVPLLLMHGAADASVPPEQTLRLALELAAAHRDYGVFVVPGGNHTLDDQRHERDRQAVEFFRRHLAGADGASGTASASR